MKCLRDNGLSSEDAKNVQKLIEDHGGMWMFQDGPLAKIFTQLRIQMREWKDLHRYIPSDFTQSEKAKTYVVGDLD